MKPPKNVVKREEEKGIETKWQLIFIENLVSVLKNGVDDPDLPAGVGNGSARISAHERGAEDDGKVVRVHAVNMRLVHDAVEVEGQRTQGGVVGVRKAVNDGVKGVAADNIVVSF